MKNSVWAKIGLIMLCLILLTISMLALLKDETGHFAKPKANLLSLEVKNVLDKADRFELLSIDGAGDDSERPDEGFHGFKILGKTEIADAHERQQLLKSLFEGIDEAVYIAACFEPRHAIHASIGDEHADLVICFECMYIQVFYGEERQDVLVSRSPSTDFNAALTRADLPLAP